MTYVNRLDNYTTLTTPASPWAATPGVVCDFGWFETATNLIFGTTTYVVNGITYPPPGNRFQQFYTLVNHPVTFDANDIKNLGINKVIVPAGISIQSYNWDLGNGVIGEGPQIATVYNYTAMPPDAAVTLSILDSLDRIYTTTRRINLLDLKSIEGTESHISVGTARL